MKEKSTETVAASSPTWETLEGFARQRMQQFLQRMLEAEVDELLARPWYARRAAVDAPGGYRNGFGKPRRLSLTNGTITLCRPRVRGLAERFERSPCCRRSSGARRKWAGSCQSCICTV
jgi:transposase-like protein